jgi:hypothetical protein
VVVLRTIKKFCIKKSLCRPAGVNGVRGRVLVCWSIGSVQFFGFASWIPMQSFCLLVFSISRGVGTTTAFSRDMLES